MSRYTIREEPIDPAGVQEVLARQDEPVRPCRISVFQMARRILQREGSAAHRRSE
jgi:hypothetical protein